MFSSDEPDQTAVAKTSGMPNEVTPSELRSSAGDQSPKVQEEVSHLEVSVASAVAKQTLPPSLTETQG